MTNSHAADWRTVLTTGRRAQLRRHRLGATQTDVAEVAGKNRDTISAVEKDAASPSSERRVSDALDKMEDEAGLARWDDNMAPLAERPTGQRREEEVGVPQPVIEFDISGDFGVHVVVKGPISDADVLREQAAALIAQIRHKDDSAT